MTPTYDNVLLTNENIFHAPEILFAADRPFERYWTCLVEILRKAGARHIKVIVYLRRQDHNTSLSFDVTEALRPFKGAAPNNGTLRMEAAMTLIMSQDSLKRCLRHMAVRNSPFISCGTPAASASRKSRWQYPMDSSNVL